MRTPVINFILDITAMLAISIYLIVGLRLLPFPRSISLSDITAAPAETAAITALYFIALAGALWLLANSSPALSNKNLTALIIIITLICGIAC